MRIIRFTDRHGSPPRYGVLDGDDVRSLRGGVENPAQGGRIASLADIVLMNPCTPRVIVCAGSNYASLLAEVGRPHPREPAMFLKGLSADGQWTRAKSLDTFCPMGPWIETGIDDPRSMRLTTRLNGRIVQDCGTDDMIFGVVDLLTWITRWITLGPGDVVLTGSPAGVGPMRVGDTIDVEVDLIGTLSNRVGDHAAVSA